MKGSGEIVKGLITDLGDRSISIIPLPTPQEYAILVPNEIGI